MLNRTCLDLAWAAVGPFFLKTVTVSQSLSAILTWVFLLFLSIYVTNKLFTRIRARYMCVLTQCYKTTRRYF